MQTTKDKSILVAHGSSLEMPLEQQKSYLTPVRQFFVCNSGSSPEIRQQDYQLRIWGDGVAKEVVLTYADLRRMEQHTVPAVLECAGNHRALFQKIDGKPIVTPPGTEELIWSTGAVGMAEWTGVPLASILKKAGISKNALQVCAMGSEKDSVEGTVRMPMPLSKAMDQNTLLALQMNHQPLTADHGFPVRVLAPGWVGAYSIKWVQDIEVSCNKIWVRRNTRSYVMIGKEWPAGTFKPSKGKPLTTLNIKSALALPWAAQLEAGKQHLHGFARSPGKRIKAVQWSDNNGQTWQLATLRGKNEIYGWVLFEFDWIASKGEHSLMTRATDESGQAQPDTMQYNTAGYLYNAVYPHPVHVN